MPKPCSSCCSKVSSPSAQVTQYVERRCGEFIQFSKKQQKQSTILAYFRDENLAIKIEMVFFMQLLILVWKIDCGKTKFKKIIKILI
ncbi:hypothetical protein ACIAD1269 [Acinetobacter baylyi ADP1]|uniref:Uncharacterized protein n=1 Tax=Acinetobacter baylyi (strain ATCC 33305 / BD413 / ADP1) TaxID=62977 RepID=Q6FCR6_ACIAD|nr:hypothetical protein ACIAD1269 [Acinetobacter baylyi ADP1]